jgi:hypothetical protein
VRGRYEPGFRDGVYDALNIWQGFGAMVGGYLIFQEKKFGLGYLNNK